DLRGREIEEYSSQGPTRDDRLKPDITAPTNEVVPGYEEGFGGTSGAAPVAAGAAALLLQVNPSLSNAQLKALLMQIVIDLGDKGADTVYGTGRLMLPPPEGINPDEGNVLGDEEGIDIGEEEKATEAKATVTGVKTQFNVKVRGIVGLSINTSFTLENYTGNRLAVVAVFTDMNGDPLESALEDYTLFDTIATGRIVEVRGKKNRFEGISLFIPNTAFRRVKESRIQFVVAIFDLTNEDDAPVLGTSEPVTIRIRR
ncbi:MAG: S8 family serine peptidase, partial [Anaerolineae bacterium]|nr:S8 family serine peptidase [Anaerolineae bacterium]